MVARKKGAKKSKAKATKRKSVKKSTAKKSTAKRTTKKAKPAKSTKQAVNTGPIGKISSVYTKSALLSTLAERTGLGKKDVSNVLEQLTTVVEAHIKRGGPGKFTLPGMLKMTVKAVPAKKARKGINPFTGEPTTFKAKPASRKIKVTALKALKDMAV